LKHTDTISQLFDAVYIGLVAMEQLLVSVILFYHHPATPVCNLMCDELSKIITALFL